MSTAWWLWYSTNNHRDKNHQLIPQKVQHPLQSLNILGLCRSQFPLIKVGFKAFDWGEIPVSPVPLVKSDSEAENSSFYEDFSSTSCAKSFLWFYLHTKIAENFSDMSVIPISSLSCHSCKELHSASHVDPCLPLAWAFMKLWLDCQFCQPVMAEFFSWNQ